MEFEQLLKLVEIVAASGLNEFDYETGDFKLHLGRKAPKMVKVSGNDTEVIVPIQPLNEREITAEENVSISTEQKIKNGTDISSPIVGVFYAASSPEAEPFVKVGERVEKGQVIGIVEAMKLMNEIQSDVSGIVTEIYVENGDGVEYGQPLICIQQ